MPQYPITNILLRMLIKMPSCAFKPARIVVIIVTEEANEISLGQWKRKIKIYPDTTLAPALLFRHLEMMNLDLRKRKLFDRRMDIKEVAFVDYDDFVIFMGLILE